MTTIAGLPHLCTHCFSMVLPFLVDKKVVELYSAAAAKYPTNGEILTQLFMAYVRIGDYQKQQQVVYRERGSVS